eukprot:13508-Heterococcus_DN1.PRE.2
MLMLALSGGCSSSDDAAARLTEAAVFVALIVEVQAGKTKADAYCNATKAIHRASRAIVSYRGVNKKVVQLVELVISNCVVPHCALSSVASPSICCSEASSTLKRFSSSF